MRDSWDSSPLYWISRLRIAANWLVTPEIDSFGFYRTSSNFHTHRYEELAGKYEYLTRIAHDVGKQMLLRVHPGHDKSQLRQAPQVHVMSRRASGTLRDYLLAASDAGADHMMITSWSE